MHEVGVGPRECPSADLLERVARGEGVESHVAAHVADCVLCRRDIEQISENLAFLTCAAPILNRGSQAGSSSLAPGVSTDFVPGYTILQQLERGSQGIVYLAVQHHTKRRVALKMLLHGAFSTDRQRQRFEHEIEVVAGLRHPGIVTVYDSSPVRGGRLAYAMEYIDGGLPLDQWNRHPDQLGKAGLKKKLQLFTSVCDAVQYAHQHGIIHRDLKPANILVDASGSPRILDFGIAKAVGAPGGGHTITGEFVGSPAYASPEQLSGLPDQVDVRTDVYSLGVILFEMLVGRRPHEVEGKPLARIVRDITDHDATRLGTLDRVFRGDLETIAAKALERDVVRRYQSAAALAADVRRHLTGRTIDARRDSAWYVLRKTLARRWGVVAAAGALTLLVIGSGVAIAYTKVQEQLARSREASQRERAAAEAVRVSAISSVLREILPPPRVPFFSEES
ncbi:MAG: serine/threonine protein kinase, partial [Pyrinomonadaceae bacterium]|nr:serine/threonine protein kinase [Phycisphaerales bacterium]